jgi:lysophospholipase L1-like esterase
MHRLSLATCTSTWDSNHFLTLASHVHFHLNCFRGYTTCMYVCMYGALYSSTKESDHSVNANSNDTICKCTDPGLPLARSLHGNWIKHHWRMVQEVYDPSHNTTLDVVFLGDSLIERLNGTQVLGTLVKPAMRQVFEAHFTKEGGGTLEGLALGTDADTVRACDSIHCTKTPSRYPITFPTVLFIALYSTCHQSRNLLWHLRHGLLPASQFFPKVWLILVGTNDIGMKHCSKQSTVDGIVNVAEFLQSRRPQAQILIHGLLPRGEGMVLGIMWKRIQWINQKLQRICKERNWHYMESGDLFLKGSSSQLYSNRMSDGIHPRISGLKVWAPRIAEAVRSILSQAPVVG